MLAFLLFLFMTTYSCDWLGKCVPVIVPIDFSQYMNVYGEQAARLIDACTPFSVEGGGSETCPLVLALRMPDGQTDQTVQACTVCLRDTYFVMWLPNNLCRSTCPT